MQRRLDLERGVNKPLENVFMSGAYSELFSGRRYQFSSRFDRIFVTNFISTNLSNKNDSRGVRGYGHCSAF